VSDIVSVIEHCYSLEGGPEGWLQRVTEAAGPLTRLGRIAGMLFEEHDGIAELSHIHGVGLDSFGIEGVREITRVRNRAQSRRMFTAGPIVAFASKVKGHPAFSGEAGRAKNVLAQFGVDDIVGVRAISEPGRGAVLSFPIRRDGAFGPREIAIWQRIATHLGTGRRLLDRMEAASPEPEAILSPSGKVEHAEEPAKSSAAQVELVRATRAIDRARGKLRRVDPEESLALWRCLVDGTWTLIDTFDSDGRRYVVAHRNGRASHPSASLASELTPRELDVLARLVEGYGNKLIAYELGLTQSTVATLLKRAASKLGASSRAELVVLARAKLGR